MHKVNNNFDRKLRIDECDDLLEAYRSDHPEEFCKNPRVVSHKQYFVNNTLYVVLEFPSESIPEIAIVHPQKILEEIRSPSTN